MRIRSLLVLAFFAACARGPTKTPNVPGSLTADGEEPGTKQGNFGERGVLADSAEVAGASPTAGASDAEPGTTSGSGDGQISPGTLTGTLTAGAWDDNQNFSRFLDYKAAHTNPLPLTDADHTAAKAALPAPAPKQRLDVALVVDTTGSMGDEIQYLKTEFLALHAAIEAKYPNAEQRWALVLYKDETDDYLTRWFVFRDEPSEFLEKLAAQSAGGGGDFPEAPDRAFQVTNELNWRGDADVARLVFWLADAPAHDENAQAMSDALLASAKKGLRIYPIASSGVDETAELTMRSAAQLTGGRYLFLTDDSGVGGAHKEPSIPCYFVTKLDAAILRMVDIEMSGAYREPLASELIRTGGDPQNGACTLATNEQVQIF